MIQQYVDEMKRQADLHDRLREVIIDWFKDNGETTTTESIAMDDWHMQIGGPGGENMAKVIDGLTHVVTEAIQQGLPKKEKRNARPL